MCASNRAPGVTRVPVNEIKRSASRPLQLPVTCTAAALASSKMAYCRGWLDAPEWLLQSSHCVPRNQWHSYYMDILLIDVRSTAELYYGKLDREQEKKADTMASNYCNASNYASYVYAIFVSSPRGHPQDIAAVVRLVGHFPSHLDKRLFGIYLYCLRKGSMLFYPLSNRVLYREWRAVPEAASPSFRTPYS